MIKRRRVKRVLTLSERLEQEVARLRARAEELPPGGRIRNELFRKAQQAENGDACRRVAFVVGP